ncbi:MAG: hypothetical protein CMJ31_05730 [Phycisphaerae bacterium]|nr:hypothetical protein [Phycisphaerae bacterium]
MLGHPCPFDLKMFAGTDNVDRPTGDEDAERSIIVDRQLPRLSLCRLNHFVDRSEDQPARPLEPKTISGFGRPPRRESSDLFQIPRGGPTVMVRSIPPPDPRRNRPVELNEGPLRAKCLVTPTLGPSRKFVPQRSTVHRRGGITAGPRGLHRETTRQPDRRDRARDQPADDAAGSRS